MIAAVDIETYTKQPDNTLTPTLDATKFTIGCIKKEGQKNPRFFTNKQQMWEYIKKSAKTEQKRNKILYIYMHNAKYDFYGIATLNQDITIQSHTPFIATLNINNKEAAKFLDSMAIWPGSLEEIGQTIGLEKLPMPPIITQAEQLKQYVQRDTEICLESIQHAKKLCKKHGINVKRMYSIGQIAICNLLNQLKKEPEEFKQTFFADETTNLVWKSKHPNKIRQALRGGTVHAKIGKHKNVTAIDCNGLYQYAATQIRFPALNTEQITYKPLETQNTSQILEKTGVTHCMIKNETNKQGFLQTRTPDGNYNPKEGKILIGTWTNDELRYATSNGYKIIDIEWTINYKDTTNPFKRIMTELHEMKQNAPTKIEAKFAKGLANQGIGKFAQHRTGQEIIITNIEETKKYVLKNYKLLKGIEGTYNMMMAKTEETGEKPYYAPIITTLINANARIIMNEQIKKLPTENWLQTDTDSIFTDKPELLQPITISKNMGDYKIVHENKTLHIRGKKTYSIGNEVKISGTRQKDINKTLFETGTAINKRIQTIKTTNNPKKIGTFTTTTRDLNKEEEQNLEEQRLLDEQKIYIDDNLQEINYFLKRINTDELLM